MSNFSTLWAALDLKGHLVFPGINDAHTHLGYSAPVGVMLKLSSSNWTQGPVPRETLEAVTEAAKTTPKGKWICGEMALSIRNSSLRRDALDKIAPDHPVILKALYGHGTIVNSFALRLLNIPDTAPDPIGGWYERATNSQVITGLLDGSAQYEAWNAYFSSDHTAMVDTLRKSAEEALKFGVTTLHHMASPLSATETAKAFKAADLPVRVRIIEWPYPNRPGEWDTLKDSQVSRLTYVSGVKYVVDGTPIEQWALMRNEYPRREGWHGRAYYKEDDIKKFLKEALNGKKQLALHVVGDKTTEIVFRFMRELSPESTWKEKRVRIEHGMGISGDLAKEASRLGVIISQPRFNGQQMRECKDAGVRLAYGSDGAPGNPWIEFRTAVVRRRGEPGLTREEAARMLTIEPAYSEFAEEQKGKISKGMLADLAVLSQDVFSVPPNVLPTTKSVLTIVDGKIAYDSGLLKQQIK